MKITTRTPRKKAHGPASLETNVLFAFVKMLAGCPAIPNVVHNALIRGEQIDIEWAQMKGERGYFVAAVRDAQGQTIYTAK